MLLMIAAAVALIRYFNAREDRYLSSEFSEQKSKSIGPTYKEWREKISQAEKKRVEQDLKYTWREGTPRLHRKALINYAKISPTILILLPLSIYFTDDGFAIALAVVAISLLSFFSILYFNREERAKYNLGQDHEFLVSQARTSIDSFTIPDSWKRLK